MKTAEDRPSAKVLCLLAVAFVVFLARGPYRALHGSADLGLVYLAARAWAAGVSPYSVAASEALAPPDFPAGLDLNGIPSPHAPAFFPLFFFYRWLDWSDVVGFNLVFGCAVFGVALWTFSARLDWSIDRRLVLLALVLFGYPLSTGVALGQPTVLAVACGLLAVAARLGGQRAEVVALYSMLGLVLKPQLGAASFLYLLFRRDFRAALLGACSYAALNALSLLFMWRDGATLESLAGGLEGIAKSSATQSDPFCCVNLNSGMAPMPLVVCLLAVALGGFVWRSSMVRAPSTEAVGSELVAYGVATTATLLSVYQRPYNLAALTPLLWFALSPLPSQRERMLAAGLLLPVVQPVPWLPLARMLEERLDSPWLAVFHAAARPLHSWTLLALLYLLAFGVLTPRPPERAQGPPA